MWVKTFPSNQSQPLNHHLLVRGSRRNDVFVFFYETQRIGTRQGRERGNRRNGVVQPMHARSKEPKKGKKRKGTLNKNRGPTPVIGRRSGVIWFFFTNSFLRTHLGIMTSICRVSRKLRNLPHISGTECPTIMPLDLDPSLVPFPFGKGYLVHGVRRSNVLI